MCRSIKTLRLADGLVGHEEIEAAALQYVRKVSGFRSPSRVNAPPFERAVRHVAAATADLLAEIETNRRVRTPEPRA